MTSRGNERRDIYRDDRDRRRFLTLLARVVRQRRWLLHAWVLMSNHYHLLIETPEVGLSRGLQWLNQRYAEDFNARHERVGHLFQGRFKGILVEREAHLLELLRYIVLNPVRAGIVEFAGDYAWSSYRATAGLHFAPKWLEIGWTLDQFASTRAAAHDAYRCFVAEGHGAAYKPWETLVGQTYLGGEAFRERVQTLIDVKKRSGEHPRAQRSVVRPAFDNVVTLVCERFAMPVERLRARSHSDARRALCQLAVDDAGVKVHNVAEWLGVTDSAASRMRQRARTLYATDVKYREVIDSIRTALKSNFQM
jgi:REP element-mobilizing transposase RayT